MNLKIVFIAFAAALAGFLFGFDTAVISGTVALVKAQFDLSDAGIGWFVSSALVGAISGVVFSGYLSDKYGRKLMLIISGLLFFISAMGCAISGSFTELVLYRLLGGVAFGIASMVSPLYISEISPAHVRGKLVSVYQLAITAGILIAYFSNYWTSVVHQDGGMDGFVFEFLYKDEYWRGMFANEVFPVLLFLGCLLFIPQSPRWLMIHGSKEKAKQIAERYKIEYDQPVHKEEKEQMNFFQLIRGVYKRPMYIAIFLMIFSQICGINAIIYYGPTILNEAGFTLGDALGGQVTIGFVNVLFTFVAIYTIDKWGRKPLLRFGALGVILSLLMISLMFFIGGSFDSYVIVGILLFIACYAFSLGPVQFVVASEIFPTSIRGRALTISTLFLWVTNAIVGQVFPMILAGFNAPLTFLLFALVCMPGIWIIKKYIPETKGKSLEEIERFWNEKF
ncbi:sugar porter family MFS transporter [Zhouia amylolytica]|uniref:Arabinose-proton symporter n=1 Tax=Zhouia amylolytica AD3 TaxID=1286632 RepID=W2UQH9_9FLAO|nr:sugar porter family MFS transporter [Zhouia amylolytica]ETN96248.1 arabinose-proton symporter [Zhouia amylolytica AD3]